MPHVVVGFNYDLLARKVAEKVYSSAAGGGRVGEEAGRKSRVVFGVTAISIERLTADSTNQD